jgi:hypothetical protein
MTNFPILPVFLSIGLAACQGNAQQVNGSLEGVEADMVFLYSTIGNDYVLIDSAKVGGKGSFSIPTESFVTGFYQIGVNDSDVVDIIINTSEPEVRLSFSGTPLQENILIDESDENQLLWEYKLTSREAQAKATALRQKKYELSNTDSLGRALIDMKIADNEEWKYNRLQELAEKMPNSYFSKVTGLARDLDRAENLGANAVLQVMDFADPELLRSSVYVKGILSYLRALPLKSEEQFLSGLDKLIEESAKDAECRNFTIDYFIDLFGQYGPELAFQHVVSKHVSEEDMTGLSEELKTRMRRIQKLRLGEKAPDVRLPDMKGDSVHISDFAGRNEATLLFFYSSTCDHCHDQMPGLKVLYEGLHDHGFEILGIALDTDTIEFEYGIQKFELPWPSFTEFLGWGSPAAKQYEVAAAPTMILLDSEMHIMAKPLNARSLKDMLKQLPPFQNLNPQTE